MSTRAIQFLRKKKIPFQVVEYEHREKGALFASEAIRFPLEKTIKTLVADIGSKTFVFALMPGNTKLDLKLLARGFSVKKAAMVDPSVAERITGYLVGGISPFGTRQSCKVVMEKGLLSGILHP
jgi:Cys-tRNA(Pro)/Cys-tRNA(Cys) deacylase